MREKEFSIVALGLLVVMVGVFLFQQFQKRDVCREFQDVEASLSCKDARVIVEKDTPGSVQEVSVGTLESPVFARILGEDKQLWLFDVALQDPFVAGSGKEIRYLRVGIPLEGREKDIFREPIDSLSL
jgi:hypothetical protein